MRQIKTNQNICGEQAKRSEERAVYLVFLLCLLLVFSLLFNVVVIYLDGYYVCMYVEDCQNILCALLKSLWCYTWSYLFRCCLEQKKFHHGILLSPGNDFEVSVFN